MDDLSFWGVSEPGEPLSMAQEWDGDELIAAELMSEEHRTQDIPAHTALFTRTYPAYTETMWVHAYPGARVIVVSYPSVAMRDVGRVTAMPGVIRTIPVGWRDMASAETFRSKFERVVESLARGGWVSKPHTVGQEGR